MTKKELREKIESFANGENYINITALSNNLKVCLSVEPWVDYVSQLLGIPEVEDSPTEGFEEVQNEEPSEVLESTPVE